MSKLSCRIAVSLLTLAAVQADAQQYRWMDDKGRVQYTDTPPPATAKGVQKKNLNAGKSSDAPEPFALQAARKSAPVKLYTSAECQGCDEARKLLNQRGIPFTEVSISEAKQLDDLKAVSGGTAVPVMLVGISVQKGFEEGAYNGALDSAGYPKSGTLRPRNQAAPAAPKPPADSAPAPQPAAAEAPKAR